MNDQLKTWHFGIDNDKLINLVLLGIKKATTSIYEIDSIPIIGEKSILVYDNGLEACITEVKEVIITEFKNITPELASLEGEGDKSLAYWKKVHFDYFKSIDPNFNENSKVIFEVFTVNDFLTKKLKNNL